MDCTRRRALRLAGTATLGVALAGCFASGDPGDGNGSSPNGTDENPGGGTDDPRVDEPPYEITEPDCGDDGRDPLWLCEGMAAEPSLAFEQETARGSVFADEGLRVDSRDGDEEFYAALLTDDADRDRLGDEADPAVDLIEGTDFAAEAVLVVETGWGSGSEMPHLERVEATDEGVHAFGCHRSPCVRTDDYTIRTVAARFERPDALASGVVSLTVSPDRRVNFAVDDGVVTLGE